MNVVKTEKGHVSTACPKKQTTDPRDSNTKATCGTLPPAGLASQIPPAYLGKPETFPNSSGMYSLPHLHIIGQH
ncbi:hypothetical protein NC653_020311 [Populus alba x Populus x berolinensis]|uniref:Uncharacterized protein n=1 Tax=Populus alba x Populus x berolinensis TaxID=444605 RepID=A0AAD6MMJ4_9ROSI|nr:hypothetical protein NC653_020311 [Populus alba x Populus x berolinensis]